MTITDVKIYTMGSAWRNFVFAHVLTDAGVSGIGEARPVNREEAVAAYLDAIARRYVIGAILSISKPWSSASPETTSRLPAPRR